MKVLSVFILTALLSFATGLFFPWWIIAIVAFVVAFTIPLKPLLSFIAAFCSLFLLWGSLAFFIDINNEHVLSTRIVPVLNLGASYFNLILASAVIGGLVAGMSALTGSLLSRLLMRPTREVEHTRVSDL
jgi:hypothetical protein